MATFGIIGEGAEEVARAVQRVSGGRHKFVDGAGAPLNQESFQQQPFELNGEGWDGNGEDPREERE